MKIKVRQLEFVHQTLTMYIVDNKGRMWKRGIVKLDEWQQVDLPDEPSKERR